MFTNTRRMLPPVAILMLGMTLGGSYWTHPAVAQMEHIPKPRHYMAYSWASERILIGRTALNKPLGSKNLFIWMSLAKSDNDELEVGLVVTRGRPLDQESAPTPIEGERAQVQPTQAQWQIRMADGRVERMWEPRFYRRLRWRSIDTHYSTNMLISPEEFKRSQLVLYFDQIDYDGYRNNDRHPIAVHINLSEFEYPKDDTTIYPQY